MSYRVVYTERFHDALDTQLNHLATQDAPEARVANWPNELLDLVDC